MTDQRRAKTPGPGPGVRGGRCPSTRGTRRRSSRRSSRCGRRPGAPNVLVILLDDVGLRRLERVRWAVPHADRRAAGGGRAEVQPVPHHGAVRADPCRAADRPQPPLGGDGRHHRAGDLGSGLQLGPAEHLRAAGADAAAQRLLDGAVRQVPRGAGLADQPDGAVRRLADRRRWLRVLLRLRRWRDQPVLPGDLRGHHGRRAGDDAGGGLPLHRGHDRQGDRLGPPAEVADAGQAVLRLLRPGCHPRAAPRPDRVVGQVPGPLRRGLGRAARGDPRPAEGARRGPARHRADADGTTRSPPGTTCPRS